MSKNLEVGNWCGCRNIICIRKKVMVKKVGFVSGLRVLSSMLRGVDLLLCKSLGSVEGFRQGSDLKVIILEDLHGDSARWVEWRKSKLRETNEETEFVELT